MSYQANKQLIDRLSWIMGPDRLLHNDLWREIYARDASYFNIMPECVVRPRSIEDVRQVLAIASDLEVGVTFRAGGTSLSGQTLGTGIICELRTDWRRCQVRQDGRKVWFEPGLTANQVNAILRPHHTHIGPDPASSSAARMGGILANNSSGMSAGVAHNSYHTLSSIEFMLANGHRYNTALTTDRRRFVNDERELCEGLMKIRAEIMASDEMREKIIRKYKIKNVTGYAMNSFVDFDDPVDIFAHLLIGSEGTLAYIIAAELDTLPLYSTYSSTLLYFPTVTDAAATAAQLGQTGALAVEMMDYASLRSSQGLSADMPAGTTAMLVDYGAGSPEELAEKIASVEPAIRKLNHLTHMDEFTHTVAARQHLWDIRDGVFPCVAGARVPGSTVILEDIAAPVDRLAELVEGVQKLFDAHGYHGAIFGHARDGNIHPLVTADMSSQKELDNFARFIDGFVDHTLKLDGSLKGEHGTGRAMAPFVAREWGDDIYSLMRRVKRLADPQGILNPGVMINDDPEAFIKPIKSMEIFGKQLGYETADKCMECGYCEHVCPTRDITLTPRQRLQAHRIIARTGSKELERQNSFIGNSSCCTDGSCQMPCPMGINTGIVTDAVRARYNSPMLKRIYAASAAHYGKVESSIRGMLKAAVVTQKVVSPYPLIWATDFMHKISAQVPHWSKYFPMPAKVHYKELDDPQWIYFPACVTRIFGGSSLGKDDLITVMLRLADRAGVRMAVPREVHGLCCSQIWEHKGDPEGQRTAANAVVEAFYRMSAAGKVPIVCDTTSCTHTLLSLAKENGLLSEENAARYKALRIVDITEWLSEEILPKFTVSHPKKSVALHPTCASRILGFSGTLMKIAEKCAEKVTVPDDSWCCGAAGDRGFINPKVAQSATRDERRDLEGQTFDGYYSLARTCEISMQATIGHPYESIVYLVDETTN